MKAIIKIYKEAPPLGKILLILMAIAICYLLFRVVKKVLEPTPVNENLLNSANTELNQLAQSGETTHYTQTQLDSFADKLFMAMDGQGTDEDAVKEVFEYMQNKADVLELIKAFGIRDYEDELFVVYPYNLTQWLNADMDKADVKEYVNDILKSKNIKHSF